MNRRSFLYYGFTAALVGSGALSLSAQAAEAITGSSLTQDEVAKLLRMHNEARAQVGVQPLAWSSEIAARAQEWADYLASSGQFDHSRNGYGENLAGAADLEEAVGSWLSEKAAYHGGPIGANWAQCGHYTQMVWGKTRLVGCGKGSSADYDIWVCCYDPAGNVRGESPY